MVIIKYIFVALLTVPPAIFAWTIYRRWLKDIKKLNRMDDARRAERRREYRR